MKQILIILSLILNVQLLAQTNWRLYLEQLNEDYSNYRFYTEKDITGVCFLMLDDQINHYQDTILIRDKIGNEILRIEFDDSLGLVTTFKEVTYTEIDRNNNNKVDNSRFFNPWLYSFDSDYFELVIECSDTTGESYKLILNENTVLQFSKEDQQFKKVSIEDYVTMRASDPNGVNFIREENPLRKKPEIDAETITHDEQSKFKIWNGQLLEIKGNWIRIKTIAGEVGWIKWREEKSVIIQFENV